MSAINLFEQLENEVAGEKKINENDSMHWLSIFKSKILKNKMESDRPDYRAAASGYRSFERRTKSSSGLLTADEVTSSTLPPSRRKSSTDPQNRVPLNDRNMGNGFSKRKEERGRKQRSAAERLVDSRKLARQGGSQNGRIPQPKRSRSVGDRLVQDQSEAEVRKSMDNIPVEIRDQFNPSFALELNKIVRQKSKRRELLGFDDPSEARPDVSDFSGTLDTISRQNQQSLQRRKSLEKALKSKSNNSINQVTASPESGVSKTTAFDALYGRKTTNSLTKPPRQKSQSTGSFSNSLLNPALSSRLKSESSFTGTNNSSNSFIKAPSNPSQESLYDNVAYSDRNPPRKRVDQPPPQQPGRKLLNPALGKDLKTATMMLRTKYSNMTPVYANVNVRNSHFSERSGSSDGRSDHLPPKAPRQMPQAKPDKFVHETPVDDGRLFMVSGQQPMLHCRNTNCEKTAGLEYAQQHYKSCVHCFTYYCSSECRQEHWGKHKEKCIYARAISTTKSILRCIFQNQNILNHLARLAKKYHTENDRGAIQLLFNSLNAGLMFLQNGLGSLEKIPSYVRPDRADKDMKHLMASYRPTHEFVVDVKIVISPKERLLYNRPYKTTVNHVSTAARLPLRILEVNETR